MRFKNRQEAGRLLAQALGPYTKQDCVIYALPRGGVVLGVAVAKQLRTPLDLIIPRKIGHPRWEEYAVCAVTEDGHLVCNKDELARLDPDWLKQAITRERAEARRRRLTYLAHRPLVAAKGKTAIIVDDGVATGLTLIAAIQAVRDREPAKIVAAVPVLPADIAKRLHRYVDAVVALETTNDYLGSVGAYYQEFNQVSDSEVIALLNNGSQGIT